MNFTIVDWFGYNLLPQERMSAIKAAGFTGAMLLWINQFDRDIYIDKDTADVAIAILKSHENDKVGDAVIDAMYENEE
jgi:hypothetical protein